MVLKSVLGVVLAFVLSVSGYAQNETETKPDELSFIKASLGVWDAEIEVWPQGVDAPSIKFKGVETNRPYGEHWIASDFDSEYGGQTVKVHSIIGYDLDQKKLVGTVVDHGPYAATMLGEYDHATKTVSWETKAKGLDGKPMVQNTTVTQTSPQERVLVLTAAGKEKDEIAKFMEIKFTKRKQ